MIALLVTCDLKKPGQDYSDYNNVIKSYSWAKLSESSYAMSTIESPTAVYNKLAPHADNDNQAYIIPLSRQYCDFGPKDENDWVDRNL
jgi:hypothetical protein